MTTFASMPGKDAQADIHVLACANQAYMQHLAVMLVSLVVNNPGKRFDLAVICGEGAAEEWQRLEATMARFPTAKLSMRRFTPGPDLHLPTPAAYSPDIYTRLWTAEFFGPEVDRVLYLDADMVVVGDIDELWTVDLEGKLLGAVDIPGGTRGGEIGIPAEFGYFNSGLLLIDVARWRDEGALARVIALVQQHGAEFRDPDQDALNACFYADRKKLDYKWNVTTPFYNPFHDLKLSAATIEQVKDDARIVHFNGISRPWSYHNRHIRKPEYYKYLALTEWRDFKPKDATPLDIARKHLTPLIPEALKQVLRRVFG